jgi:hypothetical protein
MANQNGRKWDKLNKTAKLRQKHQLVQGIENDRQPSQRKAKGVYSNRGSS